MGRLIAIKEEGDLKKFVLWKWQKDSEPNIYFLILRVFFWAFFFASAIMAFIAIDDPLNSDGTVKSAALISKYLYITGNKFFVYGTILAYACCLIQESWALLALVMFYFKPENLDGILRIHPLYIITQKIAYDFSFMLLVTYWAIYDLHVENYPSFRKDKGIDTPTSDLCFIMFFVMNVAEFFVIRPKIKLLNFLMSLIAAVCVVLITIIVLAALNGVNFLKYYWLKNNDRETWDAYTATMDPTERHEIENNVADGRDIPQLFGVAVITNLGLNLYLLALLSCVVGHFIFFLLQIVKDKIRKDEGDDE